MISNHHYGYDAKELGLQVAGYSGNNEVIVKCPNPEHNDTNPSASFNTESGLLFCFSCGYSTNAYKLALQCGLEKPTKKIIFKQKPDCEQLWLEYNQLPPAYDNPYLQTRGVTNSNVYTFDIRKSNKGIVFLFKDYSGNFVGCQIRQYEATPKYLTFGQRILWPENKILQFDPEKPIYLVEGVFGAIRGYNAGMQTLATIGAMVKAETVGFLNNWKTVYGVFDNDLAGYIAGARLLKYVPRAKIIIPGLEADEISIEEWQTLITTHQITRSIVALSNLSGDKERFKKYVG